MSEIKVDTLSTVSGSGNITVSNNIAGAGTISGTNLTASGTLAVTGNTTVGGTLVNTGLITASAGMAVGGTGAANTLDDYEEGTFEPTFTSSSGNFTNVGYNADTGGRYIKIGNLVYVTGCARLNGTLDKSNISNSATLRIGNFPFQNSGRSNGDNADGPQAIRVPVWGSGDVPSFANMSPGASTISLFRVSDNSTSHTITVGDLPSDAMVQFCATYTVF